METRERFRFHLNSGAIIEGIAEQGLFFRLDDKFFLLVEVSIKYDGKEIQVPRTHINPNAVDFCYKVGEEGNPSPKD
jgi:hypothetical protein